MPAGAFSRVYFGAWLPWIRGPGRRAPLALWIALHLLVFTETGRALQAPGPGRARILPVRGVSCIGDSGAGPSLEALERMRERRKAEGQTTKGESSPLDLDAPERRPGALFDGGGGEVVRLRGAGAHAFVFVHVRKQDRRAFMQAADEAFMWAEQILKEDGGLQRLPGDEIHMTLSQTLIVPQGNVGPLVRAMRKSLSRLRAFSVDLRSSVLLANLRGSRTYISLAIEKGKEDLRRVVDALDEVLDRFKLPKYTERFPDPRFHVSVGWAPAHAFPCLDSPEEDLSITPTLWIQRVYLKVGRSMHFF
mmetsp:Transcript_52231/g.127572  ORF Transcript_52231/g.127572 Transcript_52231/m.127572 type:complete len:306 (+) Transcript_52231:65-982(+)